MDVLIPTCAKTCRRTDMMSAKAGELIGEADNQRLFMLVTLFFFFLFLAIDLNQQSNKKILYCQQQTSQTSNTVRNIWPFRGRRISRCSRAEKWRARIERQGKQCMFLRPPPEVLVDMKQYSTKDDHDTELDNSSSKNRSILRREYTTHPWGSTTVWNQVKETIKNDGGHDTRNDNYECRSGIVTWMFDCHVCLWWAFLVLTSNVTCIFAANWSGSELWMM